jgi:Fic family protein
MHTFRTLDSQIGMVPTPMVSQLSAIDVGRGREEAFRRQHPEALKTIVEIARIQSTEASNAIENVTAPRRRIEALVADKTTPRNRSEEEIAGYRAVLDLIHSSAPDIPFRPSVVEQLHRDLYQFSGVPAGRWKTVENWITQREPDGSETVRFRTVSPLETPAAMEELHERFARARDGEYHAALLIGCYVFDFLAIHPFRDGNGRIGRLLTLLALYQADYQVGRYVSLERLIGETKETYYDALEAAGRGWHDDQHDIKPWLSYFLGILVAAYDEFEQRAGVVSGGRGSKVAAVHQFVRSSVSDEFTIEDVRQAVPGASDSYLSKVLASMRGQGILESRPAGRGSRWRRLRTDF